jgi:hypothetical protein
MKLARSKSKIVGLQTGEFSVSLIGGSVILRTKFALLTEGGETAGFFEKSGGWSEKTSEALRLLAESLETDAMPHVFEEAQEEELEPIVAEPDQI